MVVSCLIYFIRIFILLSLKPKAHWTYCFWPKPCPLQQALHDPNYRSNLSPQQAQPWGPKSAKLSAVQLHISPSSRPTRRTASQPSLPDPSPSLSFLLPRARVRGSAKVFLLCHPTSHAACPDASDETCMAIDPSTCIWTHATAQAPSSEQAHSQRLCQVTWFPAPLYTHCHAPVRPDCTTLLHQSRSQPCPQPMHAQWTPTSSFLSWPACICFCPAVFMLTQQALSSRPAQRHNAHALSAHQHGRLVASLTSQHHADLHYSSRNLACLLHHAPNPCTPLQLIEVDLPSPYLLLWTATRGSRKANEFRL